MSILIRRLTPADSAAFQSLRLSGLRETPTAFTSSYEEECNTPLSVTEAYFASDAGRNRFGAFDGDRLVGMVGVGREPQIKLRHKAFIRGMQVDVAYRGTGVGRQLMNEAMACIATMEGVTKVTLAVTVGNAAAIHLYESLGFKVYGREHHALIVDGVAYDDILMDKNLQVVRDENELFPSTQTSGFDQTI
ncbi:MAG: GNAT family N-acetyltransferase [Duganella sp.]